MRVVSSLVDELIDQHGTEAVLAAVRPLLTEDRAGRIEAVLDARLCGLTVVLENLHDPHNGAAAIRSVEGVGLTAIHVAESAERFRSASAVTIGAEKWIDVHRHASFSRCADVLKGAGMTLYATVPGAEFELDSIDVSQPCAIAFGNERDGLSPEAVAACDHTIAIPMFGFSQSFNLSVSVALAMSRLAARRRETLGRDGDLPQQERALLQARWYALSVRGARSVVERYVSK